MRIKLGVIFGGRSTEHDVSVVSGTSVIENLDKNKYEILPIYIEKNGEWYKYKKNIKEIKILKIGEEIEEKEKIDNIIKTLKNLDVIFPVLHGLDGEDGSIQGLLHHINIPYVGCKILSSSIGLDKAYTKIIFEKAKLKQVKYEYIKNNKNNYIYIDKNFNETVFSLQEICEKLITKLKFPMFIKPSNFGSSVGINKARTLEQLKEFIEYASQFDKKIIIEEGCNCREIECAVLGNKDIKASNLGEIISAEDFYSFNAKYKNNKSEIIIPANIDKRIEKKIKKQAIKAFKAIDGKGLARVDFFLDENNNIYINEVNTMPGFTKISMYPKLWKNTGIEYSELLDILIELALDDVN